MKLRRLFILAWENYKLILSIMTLTSHISKYTCHGDPLLEYSWVKEKYIFHWCPSWSRDDQATIKSYKFQSFFFQVQTTALWCYFYQDLNKLQDFSSFIGTSDSTWLPSSLSVGNHQHPSHMDQSDKPTLAYHRIITNTGLIQLFLLVMPLTTFGHMTYYTNLSQISHD